MDRERWTIAAGRTPLVSFNGRGATSVPWRDVASGSADAHLAAIGDGLRALGGRVFCMYHHEPENDTPEFGDAGEFRAAFGWPEVRGMAYYDAAAKPDKAKTYAVESSPAADAAFRAVAASPVFAPR